MDKLELADTFSIDRSGRICLNLKTNLTSHYHLSILRRALFNARACFPCCESVIHEVW